MNGCTHSLLSNGWRTVPISPGLNSDERFIRAFAACGDERLPSLLAYYTDFYSTPALQ
jgi:hypothetical protein